MVLKIKRPSTRASYSGKKTPVSFMDKIRYTSIQMTKKSPKRSRAAAVETIETRLERKATVADTKTFASESLGQMTREKRHKLLYGD